MKVTFFLILVITLTYTKVFGQLFTGGTTNFSYDNGMCIDFAPEIGYKIEKIRVGAAPFILYKEVSDADNVSFGARVYGQYDIMKDIYIQVESQVTRVQNIPQAIAGSYKSKWIISFPVGAGYRYKIADNTYAWGSVLYDFFLDENSPQKNPLVRGGVTYDF